MRAEILVLAKEDRKMTKNGLGLLAGATMLLGLGGLLALRPAYAQSATSFGEVEALASLGKPGSNGRGVITSVELTRGYPRAPGIVDDTKYVVAVSTSGRVLCALIGDKDEAFAAYDLIASKKVKKVRCVVGTDSYGRARMDQPSVVQLVSE